MIVSVYPDGALSFPSPENCTPLVEGSPSLLEVSVIDHSTSGTIQLTWARPQDLDTIPATGPYEYVIYRSDDLLGRVNDSDGFLQNLRPERYNMAG